jgi:ArsR family transcriptional regulator, arsenate/arsenite/antimonite-responsive transcriptional repressor
VDGALDGAVDGVAEASTDGANTPGPLPRPLTGVGPQAAMATHRNVSPTAETTGRRCRPSGAAVSRRSLNRLSSTRTSSPGPVTPRHAPTVAPRDADWTLEEWRLGGGLDPEPRLLSHQDVLTTVTADETLRALADPLRARIVQLLAIEQLCVCHIVEMTGARQTNVSNHLRVMRDTGLVETEAAGRYTYYRLLPDALAAVAVHYGDLAERARHASQNRRPCA